MALAKAICRCATCGEEFEFRKHVRNRKAADSFEEWAAEHITECSDCRQKRIQEEREQENMKAAQEAKVIGLPELKGSQKQIAWAESIRMKAKRETERDFDRLNDDGKSYLDWLFAHDKASFWIDWREETSRALTSIDLVDKWRSEANS